MGANDMTLAGTKTHTRQHEAQMRLCVDRTKIHMRNSGQQSSKDFRRDP